MLITSARGKNTKSRSWKYQIFDFVNRGSRHLNNGAVWLDGKIIFKYLATYTNENLAKNIKICQRRFNNSPNVKWRFQKLPKAFKIWPNWSHWLGGDVIYKRYHSLQVTLYLYKALCLDVANHVTCINQLESFILVK